MPDGELFIHIEEEYGYRDWLWVPGMELNEVKSWWKALPSVSPYFFDGPKDFPGKIYQIYFQNKDDFIFVKEGQGRVVYPLHSKHISLPKDCPRIHIHEDFDSWLTVGEEVIHHAGYVTFAEATSDD